MVAACRLFWSDNLESGRVATPARRKIVRRPSETKRKLGSPLAGQDSRIRQAYPESRTPKETGPLETKDGRIARLVRGGAPKRIRQVAQILRTPTGRISDDLGRQNWLPRSRRHQGAPQRRSRQRLVSQNRPERIPPLRQLRLGRPSNDFVFVFVGWGPKLNLVEGHSIIATQTNTSAVAISVIFFSFFIIEINFVL